MDHFLFRGPLLRVGEETGKRETKYKISRNHPHVDGSYEIFGIPWKVRAPSGFPWQWITRLVLTAKRAFNIPMVCSTRILNLKSLASSLSLMEEHTWTIAC